MRRLMAVRRMRIARPTRAPLTRGSFFTQSCLILDPASLGRLVVLAFHRRPGDPRGPRFLTVLLVGVVESFHPNILGVAGQMLPNRQGELIRRLVRHDATSFPISFP